MTMAITTEPEVVAFGDCIVNNRATSEIRIKGDGQVVDLLTSALGDGGFTVSPSSGQASSTGFLTRITFLATAPGAVSGSLTIRPRPELGTPADPPRQVTLTGTGVAPTSEESQGGSHLLIEVPDYGDTTYVNTLPGSAVEDGIDPAGLDGNTLHSYLRLGTFDYSRESTAAKQLLDIIPKAGPAKDPRTTETTDPEVSILPGVSGYVFGDDVRVRAQDAGVSQTRGPMGVADDPDHQLTKQERREESARLYARGGWRDHSDGNRISTTWGDKVEVVRGNYKMIVLGRANDPAKAMGWEASGGHIQDYAPGTMPGASFWLEWINDPRFYATRAGGDGRKGAWLLVNTTENVYQFQRTAGNLRSENWGDVHESYVGSETPPDDTDAFAIDASKGTGGHSVDADMKLPGLGYLVTTPPDAVDQAGKVRSNPHIIEKTWAKRIDSHTGSKACPVPIIYEKTWADKTWSYTGESSKRVEEAKAETWAKKTEELVDVEERIISNTRAGNIVEATTAGTITGATTAANIAELTTAGIHTEVHVGGAHLEMEVGIFHGTLEIGLKGDIQIAGGFEISIGELKELRFGKKKLAFQQQQIALQELRVNLACDQATLTDSKRSLDAKVAALNWSLNSLVVHLGI
jgi:hypothetical protein